MTTVADELLLAASDVQIEAASGTAPAVSIVTYTGGLMTYPAGSCNYVSYVGKVAQKTKTVGEIES